ncbi:Ankyrin repeat domain containing protein [Pandoravirus salinus]|uniref:Ankyrin repeat domain containing protein n=1 Tax=Pandoravirus salinus TaxID=1349410 RepID=S4VXR9_9VIRU|nr:ankyrin repeat domain [Pandoravirus salinus]AGO85163.1 Ankyrin repeat domain containing protein [Pandoravirus salinus]
MNTYSAEPPLVCMPAEVLAHIATCIGRGKDLVAWNIATGFPVDRALLALAVRRGTVLGHLGAGAPLNVARLLLASKGADCSNVYGVLKSVARGGRTDVLEWICVRWAATLCNGKGRLRNLPTFGFCDTLSPVGRVLCKVNKRHDVVLWLLSRCRLDSRIVCNEIVRRVSRPAAKRGWVDVLKLLRPHAMAQPKTAPYYWRRDVVERAIDFDRDNVIAWVLESAEYDPRLVERAVLEGSVAVAQWMLFRGRDLVDATDRVPHRAVVKAAARGHVRMLEMLHESGVHPCTRDVLVEAARRGRIDVLAWAAGSYTDGRRTPIEAWAGSHVAHGAIDGDQLPVITWLLARPDARQTITTGVVRHALASGRLSLATAIYEAGLVSFDTWNAMGAAVRSGDPDVVQMVAERGGRYKRSVMRDALVHGSSMVVAYLCQRYGTADVAFAVDAIVGLEFSAEPMAWVRDNVPAVCVADAQTAFMTLGLDDDSELFMDAPCACINCKPSV